jgi:hypothetical protein
MKNILMRSTQLATTCKHHCVSRRSKFHLYCFFILCWQNCQHIIFVLTWRNLTKLDRKTINLFFSSMYFQCTLNQTSYFSLLLYCFCLCCRLNFFHLSFDKISNMHKPIISHLSSSTSEVCPADRHTKTKRKAATSQSPQNPWQNVL